MYKTQNVVVEDVVIGKHNGTIRNIFTGGKSELKLPVTVSFLDKGKYTVKITEDEIVVERLVE